MQLPGNAKISEEDEEAVQEHRQSPYEGGVVLRLAVAGPVYRAGK